MVHVHATTHEGMAAIPRLTPTRRPRHAKSIRYSAELCSKTLSLLTERVAKVCVDELVHSLTQVADERLIGHGFGDEKGPPQFRSGAVFAEGELDDGIGSLQPQR